MRKIGLIIIILVVLVGEGRSQQMPLYSQYMLNGFLVNPAVAGSEGYSAINLTAREQWVGFMDGPSTYALSFQTRLLKSSHISKSSSVRKRSKSNSRNGNVGLGGYVFNQTNGAVSRTGIKGSYAYHIRFQQSQLSFGLSLVAYQLRLDDDKISFKDDGDELWANARKSVFVPDADAGVYFTSRDFWAGFSVDQMFESALKFGDSGYDSYVLERNYYLMGGVDFLIGRTTTFSPSFLVKYGENGNMQVDLSTKLYVDQLYWLGLTYRTANSLIIMGGVSVDRFIFGYAFDINMNSLMKYSYGTHEFTFIAKIGNNIKRYRWLNRF